MVEIAVAAMLLDWRHPVDKVIFSASVCEVWSLAVFQWATTATIGHTAPCCCACWWPRATSRTRPRAGRPRARLRSVHRFMSRRPHIEGGGALLQIDLLFPHKGAHIWYMQFRRCCSCHSTVTLWIFLVHLDIFLINYVNFDMTSVARYFTKMNHLCY